MLIILYAMTVGFFLSYIAVIKDIYYGYGQAVIMIYNCKAKVTYNKQFHTLSFEMKNRSESYGGHLGKSVYKLLVKNNELKEYIEVLDY